MSFYAFMAFSVVVFMASAVAGSSAALAMLRGCQHLPSEDFFVLLVIVLLGVVDLSVLPVFFSGEATFGSSGFMTANTRAGLLSRLFRKPFLRSVF